MKRPTKRASSQPSCWASRLYVVVASFPSLLSPHRAEWKRITLLQTPRSSDEIQEQLLASHAARR